MTFKHFAQEISENFNEYYLFPCKNADKTYSYDSYGNQNI